jgi:hypothetical protein
MENLNNHFKIVKVETFDSDALDVLLQNRTLNSTDIQRLTIYKQHKISTNTAQVVYHYGKGFEDFKIGRLYAKNNTGLQGFTREIRNTLLTKNYFELDMVNAHFYLIIKLGNDWKINTKTLQYYCDNREECLTKVSADRDIAKQLFLKIVYGGSVKEWISNEIPDHDVSDEIRKLFLEMIEERNAIMDMCYHKYKHLHKLIYGKPFKEASLMAYVLQTEELKILLCIDEFMKSNGRSVDVLIHDGCCIRKLPNELEFNNKLVIDCELHIFKTLNYNIKLKVKEMTPVIAPIIHEDNEYDESDACKKFIKLIGDKLKRNDADVYLYNDSNGLWDKSIEYFRMTITKYRTELTNRQILDNGKEYKTIYGGNPKTPAVTRINYMLTWLKENIEDTQFINDDPDSWMGKLLFKNGILDIATRVFTVGFDSNIIFLARISYDYSEIQNEAVKIKLYNYIAKSAFDLTDFERSIGEYLFKSITIAVFGDYKRKVYYNLYGDTNCGKGVLTDTVTSALGSFVSTFEAEEFIRRETQDLGRRMNFFNDFVGKRLVISNECEIEDHHGNETKLSSELLKRAIGGGDSIKGRKLFCDTNIIKNKATIYMCMNRVAKIHPVDTAIQSRLRIIHYKLSFSDNPQTPFQRKKPIEDVKAFVQSREANLAFIHLILDCYERMTPDEKRIGGTIIEPLGVIEETKKNVKLEDLQIEGYLRNIFDFTGNERDLVECKTIRQLMLDYGKFSDTKIGIVLSNMNIKAKQNGNSRVRLGLRVKQYTPPEEPIVNGAVGIITPEEKEKDIAEHREKLIEIRKLQDINIGLKAFE